MPVDQHVPLDRRFTELGDEKQMEDTAVHSLLDRMDGRPSGISWQDIYADGRSCVILGEAGSGKSQEMKHQCDALQSELSSRVSEWRPIADLSLAREHLVPTAATSAEVGTTRGANSPRRSASARVAERVVASKDVDDKNVTEPIRVLTLLPLAAHQAKAYLTGKGAVDPTFWTTVDEADAWDFLTRPLDADGMLALWQRKGRLGTWQEVVEAMVDLLHDEPRDRSALPREKARAGAEHLAACSRSGRTRSCCGRRWRPLRRGWRPSMPTMHSGSGSIVKTCSTRHRGYSLRRATRDHCRWTTKPKSCAEPRRDSRLAATSALSGTAQRSSAMGRSRPQSGGSLRDYQAWLQRRMQAAGADK